MAIDVTDELAEVRELDAERNIALSRCDFARYVSLTDAIIERLGAHHRLLPDARYERHVAQTRLVQCRTYAENWYAQRWTGFDDETPITSERLKGLGFVEGKDGMERGRIVFNGQWWDYKEEWSTTRIPRAIHPAPRTLGEVRLLIDRFSESRVVGLDEPSDWMSA